MKFRAIALAVALLWCLSPFALAQDTQKAPVPDSTTPASTDSKPPAASPDPQKSPAPDSTTPASTTPASTDSNPPAASQDKDSSVPPAAPDNTPPAAATSSTPETNNKNKNVKAGSKDDVDSIGNRNMGGTGLGNWYSLEKEIRMGKQYAMQVEQSVKLVQDPVVNEYVNRI